MSDKVFAEGIYYNPPRDGAPDFVLGSISVMPGKFAEWVIGQEADERGYVRLSVKRGKSGKAYVELDTWKLKAPAEDDPF
jgi:hypothetical protein